VVTRPPIVSTPGYLLYKAGVIAQAGFEAQLNQVGLTPRQFLLLSFVAAEELSQQDVARRLGLDPTIVGANVDDLEARGLVERSRHPSDRRRYVLELTRAGRTLLDRAEQLANESQDDLLDPLDAQERLQLAALVERVISPRLVWMQDDD
jgi:DNA-binding MarR family transcriptional regulator